MKQRFKIVFVISAIIIYPLFTHIYSQQNSKLKPIDSIIKNMKSNLGLINTHLSVENKLFFEIDKKLLEKELLIVTRFAQLPSNYSGYLNAGSKTSERVVMFEKMENKILLKEVSFTNIAEANDPISISVKQNNFKPILAAFQIENIENERFLFDVTEYFMSDSPGFNIIRSYEKENYKIGGIDKKRSFIDSARSFPNNTEILHTLTFNVNKAPRENSTKTFSFQINHSIVSLPDDPMQIRYEDKRVGWFTLEKINYSSPKLKSDNYKIVRRWRLVPSDIEKYLSGELVDPVKPIIYYLDPATPTKWRKYFKLGIEDWNSAFEKAGFKNAIIAKDPPSPDENPDFSPEDIRYSTVRYVASTTRNAVGPSVSDPRTGEILESDIIWYHNHLRSYRNRYLLETAASNPKARSLNTPEEEIGEMMRRVISHEVGHALGLPHNMKASSAYPVDSLRSGSFTQKFGIATTIMDYARYNYVAQPGDQDIRYIRKLGPYDNYSIEWGYRFYNKSSEEEKEILKKIVDDKSLNPMYMFGGYGNDPDSKTEDIGDDPIKASFYGLKNLKFVSKNLINWTTEPNGNYDDLNELYDEMISVYRRYIYHVHSIIGGINDTPHNFNQKNVTRFLNVNYDKQKEALNFLKTNLWETQTWLMDPDLVSQIKGEGVVSVFHNIQKGAIDRLLSVSKLNRIQSSYLTLKGEGISVKQILNSLYKDFYNTTLQPDLFQRGIQLYFVERIEFLLNQRNLSSTIKTDLIQTKKDIFDFAKKQSKKSLSKFKSHYVYLKMVSE